MSRQQSPDRRRALELWLESKRQKKPSEIATELGINPALVRKWKSQDKWEELPGQRRGAPKGNSNAKGNKGGKGGPPGNDKAVKHGLFRKFLPDDEETRQIYDMTAEMSRLDMLWEAIRIKWTNLIRAQKIMFVRDKEDETKVLKREKPTEWGVEEEWEYQHAWDKQARTLTSQASAMSALTRMIKEYEELLRSTPPDEVREEQRLRVEKLKADVEKSQAEAKVASKDGNKEPLRIEIDYGDDDP